MSHHAGFQHRNLIGWRSLLVQHVIGRFLMNIGVVTDVSSNSVSNPSADKTTCVCTKYTHAVLPNTTHGPFYKNYSFNLHSTTYLVKIFIVHVEYPIHKTYIFTWYVNFATKGESASPTNPWYRLWVIMLDSSINTSVSSIWRHLDETVEI